MEAPDDQDVVVDDKVCGYRLSDYLMWGGLFEERTSFGDQVHAETTRMFIRAKLESGATKVRVNPAGAFPSRRRIVEDPVYQFVGLGFPREKSWSPPSRCAVGAHLDPETFAQAILDGTEPEAVRLRRAHLLALFRYLPALMLRALGQDAPLLQYPDVSLALSAMPLRSRHEMAVRPALPIMDVLTLIDARPDVFKITA